MNKKITKIIAGGAILLSSLGNSYNAHAQIGANTYQFSALSGTYSYLTGGTAFTSVQSDDVCPTTTVPLGFTFNYCGVDYTTVRASSNGYLTFSTGSANTAYNDASSLVTVKPALFWLWDDLDGSTGNASYATTGTAPNRIFTFEFKNWEWNWSTTGPNISCQVKLYESTNIIEYQYKQESAPGNPGGSSGATIGIGDNLGTSGYLVLSGSGTAPTASSTTFNFGISAKPANGQIYRFKPLPPIDLSADSIVVALPFCSNATQPASVLVANHGTAAINSMEIHWSVDGVAQPVVNYSPPMAVPNFSSPDNKAIVPLGDVFYPDNNPKLIKAWIVQGNGLPDEVHSNDSATGSRSANLTGVIAHISPQDTVICSGTSITLDGGDYPKNPIYIWSNSQITRTITVNEAGTYIVKVQNTDGCFDRDTIAVTTHPNPLVNSVAIIDNGGGTFTFNVIGAQNITHHTWNFGDNTGDLNLPNSPSQQIHTYTSAGEYTVTLTVGNDCGDIVVTKVLSTQGSTPPTGINDLSTLQRAFSVFPNPSRSMVTISNDENIEIQSVNIYSLIGQKVMSVEGKNRNKVTFNIESVSAGIYNIVVDTKSGTFTKKLEVLK